MKLNCCAPPGTRLLLLELLIERLARWLPSEEEIKSFFTIGDKSIGEVNDPVDVPVLLDELFVNILGKKRFLVVEFILYIVQIILMVRL